MKKLLSLFCLIVVAFSSCIKDLEEENIYTETTITGVVIEQGTNKPIKSINVSLTDGENIPQKTITNEQGYFSLKITDKQISQGLYLLFSADSIYTNKKIELTQMSLGKKTYDVGTIYIEGATLPSVEIIETKNITASSIQVISKVFNEGKSSVVSRGICISQEQYPTTNNTHTTDGSGLGEFLSNMENLSPNKTYYLRAYASNGVGTAYSEQISFTTLDGLAELTIGEPSNITATSVACTANATYDGGFSITEKGFCWATHNNPTIANNHTISGSSLGVFSANISGLSPNTTYYIRAFAKNSAGVGYSEQRTFTTLNGLPTVTTKNVSNITSSSAQCGGNISSDGGFSITKRGVCFSTSPNPTINNTHTSDGTGTGSFISYLSSLQSHTTYYIRAYTTNAIGTTYGEEISFTTE